MRLAPLCPRLYPAPEKNRPPPRVRLFGLIAVVILIVILAVLDLKHRAGPAAQAPQPPQEEAQKVLEKVSKLYALPAQPEPTVATIVDVETLRQKNAFYDRAKNGDLLIVTSDRAILYDPVKNVIVDVVPIQIQAAASSPAAQSSASSKK